MKVPIIVETQNGHCSASVLGAPTLHTTAPSREEALSRLRTVIQDHVRHGTISLLEVPDPVEIDVFGAFKDDPTLQDICDEAYRARDAERAALENE